MSTSGTYTFSVSRDDIVRQAFLNMGKLDPYEQVDAMNARDAVLMLNMMVKQWMGKADFAPGLKMWCRKHGHLFLNNSTGQYNVGPGATGWTNAYYPTTLASACAAGASTALLTAISGVVAGSFVGIQLDSGALFWTTVSGAPSGSTITLAATVPSQASSGNNVFSYVVGAQQPLYIETAQLRDENLVDTPLKILTVQDYDMLPNKADPTNLQDPTAIYYENQLGTSYLYTDAGASQDVGKHIVLTYMEPIQDFNNPLDTPYFPQEWYLPLCLGLSKLLSPQYNRVWTPLMQENFVTTLRIAQQKDAERSSMYFQPGAED